MMIDATSNVRQSGSQTVPLVPTQKQPENEGSYSAPLPLQKRFPDRQHNGPGRQYNGPDRQENTWDRQQNTWDRQNHHNIRVRRRASEDSGWIMNVRSDDDAFDLKPLNVGDGGRFGERRRSKYGEGSSAVGDDEFMEGDLLPTFEEKYSSIRSYSSV